MMGICAFHEELISEYARFSRSFTESAWQTSSRLPIRLSQAGVSAPPHSSSARASLERGREDDTVLSAEKALLDTKEQIKALRRQVRQAVTLAEQHEIQEKIQEFERGGYLQGRGCDHRKAQPTHRLAGAPVSTADRGEDTLYHSLGGDVNRRTSI